MPSLSIGVSVGDEIVLERSYGWADRERERRPTSETLYAVGSVTKAFTATGIMLLVDRGIIDLDAPASRYLKSVSLPTVEPYRDPVTTRQLMQMTAGVPHIWWHNWSNRGRPSPPIGEFLNEFGMIVYPPGQQFFYSNLSYGILEQMIADQSGQTYERFMRDEVFLPLGMTSTRVVDRDGSEEVAVRYDAEVEGPLDYVSLFPLGAGGFSSTIRDLLRFGISHLGERPPDGDRILSSGALETMKAVNSVSDSYGLGFGVWDDGTGVTLVSSNGSLWGGAATLRLAPSAGLVVVAATNTANLEATDRLTREIIEYALPQYGAARGRLVASGDVRVPRNAVAAGLKAGSEFQGGWTGGVLLPDGVGTSIRLTIGDAMTICHDGEEIQPDDVKVRNGVLRATYRAQLEAPELGEGPHDLTLYLRRNGQHLNGFIRAEAEWFSLPFGVSLEADEAHRARTVHGRLIL